MAKVYLLNILPGLGKTFLEENNDNYIDYHGWMKRKGKAYSHTERGSLDPISDIKEILSELNKNTLNKNIFIMSAVFWDDMRFDRIKADVWVHMKEGQYNCDEVKLRDRSELCERYGEDLVMWNDRQITSSSPANRYILESREYIDTNEIEKMCLTSEGFIIEDGTVDIDDDDDIFEEYMRKSNSEDVEQERLAKERSDKLKADEQGAPVFNRRKPSKIFNFSKITQQYYIIGERAVIVFQLGTRDKYCYWDVLGGEDHRLILSAKGPFNENLYVKPEKPWSNYRVSEDDFMELTKMTGLDFKKLWASYSTDWFLNMQEINIFKV